MDHLFNNGTLNNIKFIKNLEKCLSRTFVYTGTLMCLINRNIARAYT